MGKINSISNLKWKFLRHLSWVLKYLSDISHERRVDGWDEKMSEIMSSSFLSFTLLECIMFNAPNHPFRLGEAWQRRDENEKLLLLHNSYASNVNCVTFLRNSYFFLFGSLQKVVVIQQPENILLLAIKNFHSGWLVLLRLTHHIP